MKTKKILAGALAAAVVTTSLPGMGVPVFAADSFLTPDSNCYTTDNPFAFPTEAGEVQTLQAERATTLYNKESNDGGYPMKILTNNDRTYVKDMLKNGDYATYAYTAEAGLYLVTAHYYCGGNNTMILSDAGTKNNNVNTVLMSVGTTNSQWKTKQFLLKINNTGAGTLKIASTTNEDAPYLDKLEITKMEMQKYEGENRFEFPIELNSTTPTTLEAEYGIITNHVANDDGDYPAQEKKDNDRGQTQWTGNGYYLTSVNTGDSVAYAYHAEKPGIYEFTATYRSGSNMSIDYLLDTKYILEKFVSSAEESAWLPHYYNALCFAMKKVSNDKKIDELFSCIIKIIEKGKASENWRNVDTFIKNSFDEDVFFDYKKRFLKYLRKRISASNSLI